MFGRISKQFISCVRRPKVVMCDDWPRGVGQVGVVKLDGGLIGFGDEDRFRIYGSIAICIDSFTDPDVVVIVGIFNDLDRGPSGGCRIVGLFRDRG